MLMFMRLLFLNGLLDYGPKITQPSLTVAYIDIEGSRTFQLYNFELGSVTTIA